MNAQQFVAEFGHIANAPGGVARLREMALALAMQGRLVEQSHSDEPAIEQLRRIRTKALKAESSGRRRKTTRDEVLPTSSKPLPSGWSIARLSNLVRVLNGRAYAKSEFLNSGTPILRVGNLFTSETWYYSDLTLEDEKYCNSGDLLYAWSASFGPFIWNGDRAIFHYHIWKLDFFSDDDLDRRFFYLWLLEKTQEIKASGHGISMVHMTKEKFEQLIVELPPIQEQTRIVAKVDELMALCDKLEAQQQERESRKTVLAQALFARFAEEPTRDNLHSLFQSSRVITPADLRKAILTLAVQGKLVRQDPNDERMEQKILKQGLEELRVNRRKSKVNLDIFTGNTPYPLPASWLWAPLGACGLGTTGRTPPTADNSLYGGSIPFIGPGQIDANGNISVSNKWINKTGLTESSEAIPGDILMVCIGGSIGKSAIAKYRIAFNQQINSIRTKSVNCDYLHLTLQDPRNQKEIIKLSAGSATPIINKNKWEGLLIPLPPLAEQCRIVAKVDELMAIVDKLEVQLATAHTTGKRMVDATVAALTGITTSDDKDLTVKAPPTELIANLHLGRLPDVKQQAPLATMLARHQGSMAVGDLCQRFGGDTDAFYAQLKIEVTQGWIQEPAVAEVRIKPTATTDA